MLLNLNEYSRARRTIGGAAAVGLASTFVWALTLAAAAQGTVRGSVVDSEGSVMWLAYVFVHPDLTAREGARPKDQTLQTARDGRFSVQLDVGFYDICVMSDSFTPVCQKITVEEGKTVTPRFQLAVDWDVLKHVVDTFPTATQPR